MKDKERELALKRAVGINMYRDKILPSEKAFAYKILEEKILGLKTLIL